jgi:membrane protein YqaA with SNARE-associated domain
MRRLYDWVLHWAETPYGVPALFVLAFTESSVFPLPPDVLLIALALGIPKKSFRYAAVCTVGSVFGGMLGYVIGLAFIDTIGVPILNFYGVMDKYEYIRSLYMNYDAWAVGLAGFTPIPYKVFTIAAGAFKIDFVVFVLASVAGRAGRFFLVGLLIYRFGTPIKKYIDKYFNIFTIIFFVLLALGFAAIKYIF